MLSVRRYNLNETRRVLNVLQAAKRPVSITLLSWRRIGVAFIRQGRDEKHV